MAKKDEQKENSNGHDSGGIKVRVIEFELHGRNATVSEGIKAITEAISGHPVVNVAEPKRPALPAVSRVEHKTTTLEAEEFNHQDTAASEVEAEEAETPAQSSNGAGAKRSYSFKAPTFLNDLDLTKAKKPLDDFIAQKSPGDVIDKYLVVAFWLQKYMDVEEVTVDHIYTVFDHLGWKGEMPVKPGKPLADLKSKRHVLVREEGAAGYKLNFKGEQYVENMGAKK
jgi:hypothetical protein